MIISKREHRLDETLSAIESSPFGKTCELLVVDASEGALSSIQREHPGVRWIDFEAPTGRSMTIPHQRNLGVSLAKGEIIVLTDAGWLPAADWLERLTRPIMEEGEKIVAGPVRSGGIHHRQSHQGSYVLEWPTANVAFEKSVWAALGGFDESFDYGSDVDFSWRAVSAGCKIRWVDEAVVFRDSGDWRRQLKRSYVYGKARTKLYRKHPGRRRALVTTDPVPLGFALFLLGSPIGLVFPAYFLILAVPLWRVRHSDSPFFDVLNGFVLAIGALVELVNSAKRSSTPRPVESSDSNTAMP